ncbi:MAG: class I adenylate-forming enzyme family protein, partial [Pseudomonadota bacterium]
DDPDAVIYLAFTSGTTGAPKCVMHSANTLLANARDMVTAWDRGPDTRILTLSPLSHHIAWVAVAQWLLCGGELITDDPSEGISRLDWITETGATYVMGVPTHAIDLLAEQRAQGADRMGAVETFYMAGAPIPPSVAEAFVRQGIRPQNVYGMTENSSHQFTDPHDDIATITETCGRGGPAYRVQIFDVEDPDRPLGPGEIGQIGGRGACLMLGYFANQEATEGSFNGAGWFLSGDLGMLDEAGNLKVSGRLKDLIIRGGHNIHPSTIEALALRHGAVDKAAAFPVADERLGERVCLAIAGALAAQDLLQHLDAEGLSVYDMPEYYLNVKDFPLTASGKILKRELVLMVERGELTPEPVRFERKEKRA